MRRILFAATVLGGFIGMTGISSAAVPGSAFSPLPPDATQLVQKVQGVFVGPFGGGVYVGPGYGPGYGYAPPPPGWGIGWVGPGYYYNPAFYDRYYHPRYGYCKRVWWKGRKVCRWERRRWW